MQPNANAEGNRTPEVDPPIKHTVAWRVTTVSALPDARLRVTFVDGTAGEVEMDAFLRNPDLDGTIFEPLRDPVVFAQAQVVLGAIHSGRTEPTLRQMQCTTLSVSGVSGSLIE